MGSAGGGPRCNCCYDDAFDDKKARAVQRDYRRHGAGRATKALAAALAPDGAAGLSVIDVGGGIGGLHHLLIGLGAVSAIDVDASGPYLEVARQEAERLGISAKVAFRHGDFAALADEVGDADLIGLDRVVCCYPDAAALIGAAARHARCRLGVVMPPDGAFGKVLIGIVNAWEWLTRSNFWAYAHPHHVVASAARDAGLELRSVTRIGPVWRLLAFERPAPQASTTTQAGG